MSRKKMILTSVVLLVIILIGGLLAYFTDTTEETTNVFTLGNVAITLTEPNWTSATNPGANIAPNKQVAKDPTITNTGTNDALVFMKVVVPYASVKKVGDSTATAQQLFTYTLKSGWSEVGTAETDTTNHTITHVYAYGSTTAMTPLAKNATATVFDNVTMINVADTSIDNGDLTEVSLNIKVKAYAIQKETLETSTPTAVWDIVKNN